MAVALTGGTVVQSLHGPVLKRDLHVDAGVISAATEDVESVDASGCLVMPGNVCAHHHLYSSLARGMPGPTDPPGNFVEILERVWWRLDRALDLETIELSAQLGAVLAARFGTTAIVDHHASPDAIDSSLDAVAEGIFTAGVRGIVCYEVSDRHGRDGAKAGIAENERFLKSNERPLVRSMVGAHASFTIGPETMEDLVAVARDAGAPIHIHVAEDAIDQQDSLERYDRRVVERLLAAGALGEGDVIAHGVHLDEGELESVRASGAWVVHNPRSNMNNGVGYAPAARMGERVALGTDGIDGDMFAETQAAYWRARADTLDASPSWATARLATGAAVVASVFGEPALGSLEVGAPADLVVLDYDAPTPLTDDNLSGHLVFGTGAPAVRDVMVAGRWVIRNRRHQLIDEAELAARCREAAARLWMRMEEVE